MEKRKPSTHRKASTNRKRARIAQEERKRRLKRRRRKRAAVMIIEILILIALGIAAYAIYTMDKMEQKVLDKDELEVYKSTGDYTNIALFGLDSREGEIDGGVQSDCMMVASINNTTNEIKLISLYRDTLLQQADGEYRKANSAYAKGGPAEAIALMNRCLDLDIEKYISVNFNAMADVVDALGGIELELTEDETIYVNGYAEETSKVVGREVKDIAEKEGVYNLDGVQAVSYARIRYTEGMDFKRTQRQRIVLEKIFEKVQEANVLTLNNIIHKVLPQVSTNLTLTNFMGLAAHANSYSLGEMSGFPFEVTTSENVRGMNGSYVIPVGFSENVTKLHLFLFDKEDYIPSETVTNMSNEIIWLSGVDPETYGETIDYTYHSAGGNASGESIDEEKKQ